MQGVNPRVTLGLESHFRPIRYEWVYRIAPKIIETLKPYHDDNLGTQLAGAEIGLWVGDYLSLRDTSMTQ